MERYDEYDESTTAPVVVNGKIPESTETMDPTPEPRKRKPRNKSVETSEPATVQSLYLLLPKEVIEKYTVKADGIQIALTEVVRDPNQSLIRYSHLKPQLSYTE